MNMILKIFRQLIFLFVFRILDITLAQTTCNSGQGKVFYERLPNQQLQGFDDDVVRDTAPPFRVLEKCQDLCLRDRTATNNLVRACTSIDFQPGSRIASFSGNAEYEESTCYLTREQATPEGIGNLMLVPNSVHFTEVCLTSNRPERECPSRRYVFERYPRKKLKLPVSDMKEITAANRTDCEDKCLNEFSFVCRSANYDVTLRSCTLSRFTRRTHPELLEDDPNSDYLENSCLNAERRCDGLVVFVKEENKKLGGPFEVDIFNNMTLDECQSMCLRAEKYFCRSVEFDDHSKQCILSEEDSISQKDDISISSSPTHHFYDLVCLDNQRGTEYPDNSVTSHLFSNGRRPDTAFQRYRNSRLGGEFHSEITGRSLSECLDECLRQTSFQCRSAVYSDRFRTCRLSRYNQRDGMRIIYDADYDYYENLMIGVGSEAGDQGSTRPDMDWHEQGSTRPDNRIPGRFPTYNPFDRFTPGIPVPEFGDRDRFPTSPGPEFVPTHGAPDRYPNVPSRRPPSRYPPDTYNEIDRYPDDYDRPGRPGGSSDGGRYPDYDRDRYPPVRDRYPPGGGSKEPYPDDYYGDHQMYPDTRNPPNRGHPVERPTYPVYPPPQRYPVPVMPVPVRPPVSHYNPLLYNMPKYPDPGQGYPENKYLNPMPWGKPAYHGGGMNRFPMNVFKYGNQGRYPYGGGGGGGGYGQMMPAPDFGDRGYGMDRFGARPPYIMVGFGPAPAPGLGPGPGPVQGPQYETDNAINSGHDIGYGVPRPIGVGTRCDEADSFKQMGVRKRMRKQFIVRAIYVPSLVHCQRECSTARDFICRSFNYKDSFENDRSSISTGGEAFNCELSDRDTRELDMQSNQMFDASTYDFYERSMNGRGNDGECLDVSQVCNEDGMEFTLRTNEPFVGRIYSYGFYDRCFFRGNGGSINVLRISGPQGFPECGTQRYGDTMTNIIVVQFSDNVQTSRDKRFNLTCLFRGPGESVVTSGYIGAGSGSPIPIEYLPAENSMSSKVQMYILYQGRPTTTIAVGDPLTFRLESMEQGHVNDIFATNVIARDPYSGKSVLLIDRYGCPVDTFVFPELGRSRDGDSLEARFNAFKIPESNFLVFEATVKTCRDGCQPVYCNGANGRSFGRRKRALNETTNENLDLTKNATDESSFLLTTNSDKDSEAETEDAKDFPERVREMIEVFESREEMLQDSIARRMVAPKENVCLSYSEYYGLLSSVILLMLLLVFIAVVVGVLYRKYWSVITKNRPFSSMTPESLYSTHSNYSTTIKSKFDPNKSVINTDSTHKIGSEKSIFSSKSLQKTFATGNLARLCQIPVINPISKPSTNEFDDPSEPIYSDVNLFERSRLQ